MSRPPADSVAAPRPNPNANSANSGVAIYKCINDHGVWVPKGGIDRLVLFIDTWDRALRQNGTYYVKLAQLERKRFLRKVSL